MMRVVGVVMSQLVDKFNLNPDTAKSVIEGVAGRAYSLLLGAGASYGVAGGDGCELKGAADLAKELNSVLGLGLVPPDSENLSLVYGDACQPIHATRLHRFLEQRFTRTKPVWQRILYEFNWKRIWSLNIDDVIQRAQSSTNAKRLVVYNWTDEFKPRDRGESELQLVHLHGMASRLKSNDAALIFSLKEYATRNEALPGWHAEFRSEYSQKPFIVCGARLQDEFDLISVLEFGNRSKERGGAPSLVVLPSYSPGQESRLQNRFGLIPVTATGDAFFEALAQDVKEYLQASRFMDSKVIAGRNELRSAFRPLEISSPSPQNARKVLDFYASAEANWGHICENLDAKLSVADQVIDWLARPGDYPAKVAIVTGGPISGKSATLLRIGYELISRGKEVWLFRGEQLFDSQAVIEYLKVKHSAVLLMDDAADFSSGIQELIAHAKAAGANIRVVLASENSRKRAVAGDVADAEVAHFSQEPLGKGDFYRIFEKRSIKARLGSATGQTKQEAWKHFENVHRMRLLEWLEGLENANDYREALRAILRSSGGSNESARKIVSATACVQRFNLSLPFFIAAGLSSRASIDTLVDEGGVLSDVAYIDSTGVRLRNSAFAKFAWNCFSADEKFEWSLNLALRVAPLVVPLSVTNRTIPYLIAKSLMDAETAKRDLGTSAESWYARLEQAYGWNARFWEQRGLLASDEGRDLMAYSYAKKAVAIHGRDAFAHTTLGKVCLKIAVNSRGQVAVDRFWEGVASLERSRKISTAERLEWEHPFVTFFTYALQASRLAAFENERSRLASAWVDWMRAAHESRVFDNHRTSALDDFARQWLLISVATSAP